MANQTPEQKARDRIDSMLEKAGWVLQDRDKTNLFAAAGIAIREYPTDSQKRVDYVLFVDRKPCGVIEAKKEEEGQSMTAHENQTENYAKSKLKYIKNEPLPFIYKSTGIITDFMDARDPKPRSRVVYSFHKPETLLEWLKRETSLRSRLNGIPLLDTEGLRRCQIKAIVNLEESFKNARPRALVQMATGSGKTFTAITAIYRLLKFADAKRVLFLVDTKNLGEQAEQEFMSYTPADDNRKFTELYNVQRLKSSYIATDSQVCISTIQRMYSILRAEELDEAAEQDNPHEYQYTGRPKEIEYSDKIPIEFFDFIVIDECHRSIYNIWKQVLEYFDAFLIGLTATPDNRTFGFFEENVVSEYPHEEAVADNVNVGFDIYIIDTEITTHGAELKAQEYVDKRHRLTRKKRWEQLDEDYVYSATQLDRDVVNPSQIRNVIRAFKNALPDIFPGRKEVPKTLIFAKTDSHADDIIGIVRSEFNEGNEFCLKITYNTKDPKAELASFRNDFNPRIAVTVDMIATGTDVKPLECLLFMRDVRARNYFEQMKGRGTRTLDYDDLKRVTPSVKGAKDRFVIVDAVKVTQSLKTDSRPLERKKTVPMKDLLNSVMMGADDEDSLSSLAGRLSRLAVKMTPAEKDEFAQLCGGKPINGLVLDLLAVINPDKVEEKAREMFHLPEEAEADEGQIADARAHLFDTARSNITGPLITFIEQVRRIHEQIIDTVNIDTVLFSGWDKQAADKARERVEDFETYIRQNKDEITALRIFYSVPFRGRELTHGIVKELLEIIRSDKPTLAPLEVWQAYEMVDDVKVNSPKSELTALVALIRRVTGMDERLTPYNETVRRNFQDWVMTRHRGNAPKFNEEQMTWLRMIRDHIEASFHIENEDLYYAPFDGNGGIGRMHQLFGDEMTAVMDELNEALSA